MEATLELEVKVGVELEHAESIAALAAAVEAKDENTKGHNTRVAELAVQIGRAMELPTDALRTLARAGLLHDVGKIGIPDAVLNKPGPLDAGEWTVIKRHPELGHEILLRVPSLRREAEIVIAHHERIDGSGYPRGLRGAAIPLEARILAVADTYDVLISNRPYRQAFDRERALRILREESGRISGSQLFVPCSAVSANVPTARRPPDHRNRSTARDYRTLIGEDRRDVHLVAVDRRAEADLAKVRAEDVVAMFGRVHPPGLGVGDGLIEGWSPRPVDVLPVPGVGDAILVQQLGGGHHRATWPHMGQAILHHLNRAGGRDRVERPGLGER
jgi:hypothetical protein